MNYILRNLTVFALILLATLLLVAPSALAQTTIIVPDPEGDDKGPGFYGYPTGGGVFGEGVFDLTKFEVSVEDNYVVFKVHLKNLGGNPWGGPNGWSLQYVGIFIRTSTPMVLERSDTFGLGFILRPDYSWHYAVILAPGWGEPGAPVPAGEKCALYFTNGSVLMQTEELFACKGLPDNNLIEARIKKDLLSDIENIAKWKIVVAVTSYDGFGPARIRPLIAASTGEWQIPATAYAKPEDVSKISLAILKVVAPRVMDLALYSPEYPNGITADQQYLWLSSFDVEIPMPAQVPSIVLAPQTTTLTVTQIHTTTFTTVSVSTFVTTTTTTVKEVDWATTIALVVVMLVVGIAIGYIIKRK